MKKIYIAALVVLAAAALNSCMQEKSFKDVKVGEKDIVFSLQGAAATRAAEAASVQRGVKLELEANEDGQKLFLEETIEDLNYASPATKGTPVYTENVGKMHEKLGVVIMNGNTELLNTTTGFYAMDDEMYGGGWRYQGEFDGWPKNEQGDYTDTALDFYLWLPADTTGLGFKNFTRGKTNNNLNFSFSYTSPTTAADQEDIIFAARPISKSEAETNRVNGVPVLFNHALTGVKFAIANYDSEKKISIKSVSFKGLVGTASCVVTPAVEDNYKDNRTNYTSGTQAVVNWTIPENADRSKTYSSGTYADTVYYAPNGSFKNNGNYPSSFSEGGNKHNLNDADATQTFWFIPQTMTDDVELTIEYTYGSDEKRTGVLEFGKALKNVTGEGESQQTTYVEWKAGQLRTYTIRVDEVNVKIQDVVTATDSSYVHVEGAADDEYLVSYEGATKTAVAIQNTGNTDAYIRVALIGQWLDAESGDPVFGYTDFTSGEFRSVDSWYEDQFVGSKPQKQGKFTGLPGTKWTLKDDGFYYYSDPVAPGKFIGTAPAGADNPDDYLGYPLFTEYKVGTAPAAAVSGEVRQIYFQLEIATQAISAMKQNGDHYTMDEAWARANTPDPTL